MESKYLSTNAHIWSRLGPANVFLRAEFGRPPVGGGPFLPRSKDDVQRLVNQFQVFVSEKFEGEWSAPPFSVMVG